MNSQPYCSKTIHNEPYSNSTVSRWYFYSFPKTRTFHEMHEGRKVKIETMRLPQSRGREVHFASRIKRKPNRKKVVLFNSSMSCCFIYLICCINHLLPCYCFSFSYLLYCWYWLLIWEYKWGWSWGSRLLSFVFY